MVQLVLSAGSVGLQPHLQLLSQAVGLQVTVESVYGDCFVVFTVVDGGFGGSAVVDGGSVVFGGSAVVDGGGDGGSVVFGGSAVVDGGGDGGSVVFGGSAVVDGGGD